MYTHNPDYRPEIYYDRRTCEPILVYRKVANRDLKEPAAQKKEAVVTKGVRKRKVAWVQDMEKRGGAELSNEVVVRVGIECGNEINLVTNHMDVDDIRDVLRDSDLVVVNNIFHFSKEQMKVITSVLFAGKPYVKYDHDFGELIKRPKFGKELFSRSILNVFLSPVHREKYRDVLGVDGICLPLAIDVDFFRPVPYVVRKEKTALAVRDGSNIQDIVDANPDFSFTVLSDSPLPLHGKNLMVVPAVPYEKMPEVYSEHEYFLYFRKEIGTAARVVFEASLCGCKVIAGDLTGHLSWGFDLNDVDKLREVLRKAPYTFWREIDRRLD